MASRNALSKLTANAGQYLSKGESAFLDGRLKPANENTKGRIPETATPLKLWRMRCRCWAERNP